MLTTKQLAQFYLHLQQHSVQSAIPLLHSPFTTNTFPTSQPPHPYPFIIHNPDINTIPRNLNSMHPRQSLFH
ncbi:hypothetical protein, partial [Paenibacillus xylanexedens]|uniref:hypothetical protein n=1 Tax=Paenibacillus xylanexedens TaxID=528191 RepID=UPI0034D95651